LKFFRIVSLLEGISYLIIFSVTLGFISREYVFALGMMHGALFMVYLFSSLHVSHKQTWPVLIWLAVFLAAIIPFAFIGVDMYLRKQMNKNQLDEKALALNVKE